MIRGDNAAALASKHFKIKCFSFQRFTEETCYLIPSPITSQRRVIKLMFKLLKHWCIFHISVAAFHKLIAHYLIVSLFFHAPSLFFCFLFICFCVNESIRRMTIFQHITSELQKAGSNRLVPVGRQPRLLGAAQTGDGASTWGADGLPRFVLMAHAYGLV